MNSEDGFLSTIRAEPDDDAPRLVYADWLEENGNLPRAEFIRVQCRLATMDRYDPRRQALLRTEKQFLKDRSHGWANPLDNLVSVCHFRRGFAEHVEIHAEQFLERAEEIFTLAPVRSVHFRNTSWSDYAMRELAASPYLQRLCAIGFAQSSAGHGVLGCGVGNDCARIFFASDNVCNLKALHIPGNRLSGPAITHLVGSSSLSNLTTLDLSHNMLDGESVSRLATSPWSNCLIRLNLSFNTSIDTSGVRAIADTPCLDSLDSLSLAGCGFNSHDLDILLGNENLPLFHVDSRTWLRSLDLSGNPMTRNSVRVLARSPFLSLLTHLDLSRGHMGEECVRILAASPHLAGLRSLALRSNGLGKGSAMVLAKSPRFPELRILDLGDNRIHLAGAESLAQSTCLRSLVELDLSNNELSESDKNAVRRLCPTPRIVLLGGDAGG